MSMLSVKIDYVAALRSIKKLKEPDPIQAAVIAELSGADSISCQLREDRTYIRDRDIYILKELVKTQFVLQIAPTDDLIERALEIKPARVTLMPSGTNSAFSIHGIDFNKNAEKYTDAAGELQKESIEVGFFVDPEQENIKAAARVSAYGVELNTHSYTSGKSPEDKTAELDLLEQSAILASKLGMFVGCGGGLDYKNVAPLVELDCFQEFTIGYALTSRAVLVGYEFAVREMAEIIHR